MQHCLRVLFLTQLLSHFTFAASLYEASVDLRPSWSPKKNDSRFENEFALNYRATENLNLSYVQEFQTPPFELRDGYFKTEQKLSHRIRLETRSILPTNSVEREKPLNFAFRPILTFVLIGEESRSIELSESIVARWYRESLENNFFENRMELISKYSFFSEKLLLKLPIVWQSLKRKELVEQILWISSEVIYALDESISVGLAFYSENLITENGFRLIGALEEGTVQAVLQARM